jgi:septal ring factor EnvC (AmiA/AmiB activator)
LAKEIARVRYRTVQRVVLFVMLCGLAAYLGCAAPKPCVVSPVQIEEIASDIRDLDVSLAERKGVLANLRAEIAELEASIAEKSEQVPVMRAELQRLRKASGRTEKPEPETTASGSGS